MDKIAIVILNFDGKNFLQKFLPEVISCSGNSRIIVADNDSTDGSVSYLEENFPSVHIIKLPFNGGFCTGYNLALTQVKAEYYVLLNSDVQVTPNWLEHPITLMDSDPMIAACQPKIKSFNSPDLFEYAGAAGGYIDKLGYPFCRGRIFNSLEKDLGQYNDEREIFWATGACMFIRAELFHQLGGFDPDFFAHMEEIDLCWRLKNNGYKIFYSGKSEVYHVGGGTLAKVSPKKTFLNFRNSLFVLTKNMHRKYLIPVLYLRLILDGLAALQLLFTESFAHSFAVLRAHFSFYFSISAMLRKRKGTTITDIYKDSQVFPRFIVWNYFVKSKKKFTDLNFHTKRSIPKKSIV